MMVGIGTLRINGRILTLLRTRTENNHRTVIVGLKSDNCSREMLLRVLSSVVKPGDNVLAVHVQDPDNTFDPNTFHIHEDLCKSKQVDFQVKVCIRNCFITELSHQVRINFATILAIGCSDPWPKDSTVAKCLKALPPTCSLLVMDIGGRILVEQPGTSQQGINGKVQENYVNGAYCHGSECKFLRSSVSALTKYSSSNRTETQHQIHKSLTMPSPSTSSYSPPRTEKMNLKNFRKTLELPRVMTQKLFQRLATLEAKGTTRRFTPEELAGVTDNFHSKLLIGEGGHSMVYRAILEDRQDAAVKVLKATRFSEDDLLREVEVLSGLQHENVVQLIGYCYNDEMHAIVYNLLKESLKQKLKQLRWNERLRVAIDVAKALNYLHSRNPPIIHRDVKSSNILLSDNGQPQLSDFGAAMLLKQTHQASANAKPFRVVGTFGYLAPEYMMYGKVDEKTDVYSYGVVLLELITGKEAIRTDQALNHESLVLWARSLLSCGLCERLIDPCLNGDYKEDEMKTMMIAARLCLLHSSSRRPTMNTILRLFEEPNQWLEMQRKREELLNRNSAKAETELFKSDESETSEALVADD